jgi:hypothetical protein
MRRERIAAHPIEGLTARVGWRHPSFQKHRPRLSPGDRSKSLIPLSPMYLVAIRTRRQPGDEAISDGG